MKTTERSTKNTNEAIVAASLDWRTTVGLNRVFSALDQVIASGRMHPVVLLHGLDGVGKRHVAVWMAARFLCRTQSACGECASCREVIAGIHPDLMMLDEPEETVLKTGALEELQRNLDMMSSEGVRVAVITDCDRMTREAANRMLKTLEEPPEHVRLILTTSRPRALLPTVLGRCLNWRVSAPSEEALLPWLKQELQKRGRSVESDEFYQQWLKRLGNCPGLILRELGDADDRGPGIASRVRSLLTARSPSEALRVADDLTRTTKASLGEILAASEWELNRSYRNHEVGSGSVVTTMRRRRLLQTLRLLSVRGKVHLNTQLAAESIGLAAFSTEYGEI